MSDPLAPAETFRRGLEEREFRFQRCGGCEAAVFPPRVSCPACGATQLGWEVASGHGTVYATTLVSRRGGEPYDVTLVDLDDGFRAMTRVVGVAPDAVEIGARGRLEVTDGDPLPPTLFRLDDPKGAA